MSSIVPAILPTSREDLERKASILVGIVDVVQIDVVDGKFASPPTWPYNSDAASGSEKENLMYSSEEQLPFLGQLRYEMDLMIIDPEKSVASWIAAGAERLVFHEESSSFLVQTMQDINTRYGHDKDFAPDLLSLGVALNIETDVALLDPFLEYAEYVQFMGIANIGKQGQPFDERVLRKISQLRTRHPEVTIQVDGGVDVDSARALLSVGVDRLIIGSAIWKSPSVKDQIELFKDIVKEYSG